MATARDIRWSAYRNYEGPFYPGKCPFMIGEGAMEAEKVLAVITATEGGRYDAINMYDGPPVLSSGLIQFIEGKGQRSVTQMLGESMLHGSPNVVAFYQYIESLGLALRETEGKWYLCVDEYRSDNRVDTAEEQNWLFRGGSTGEKGSWTDKGKEMATRWAVAVASVWECPLMQKQQERYTIPLLRKFAFGSSANWIGAADLYGGPVAAAFTAAYLSFAVNNPTRANKHLGIALKRLEGEAAWTTTWLIEILKELTFGPKIAIYPHRYNAIRPALEQFYGVNLPDFAKELDKWKADTDMAALSAEEVQKALISLGHDLGPYGADGKWGPKTTAAMLNFEQAAGVPTKHCDGMIDVTTYSYLEEALYERGVQTLAGLQEGSSG